MPNESGQFRLNGRRKAGVNGKFIGPFSLPLPIPIMLEGMDGQLASPLATPSFFWQRFLADLKGGTRRGIPLSPYNLASSSSPSWKFLGPENFHGESFYDFPTHHFQLFFIKNKFIYCCTLLCNVFISQRCLTFV